MAREVVFPTLTPLSPVILRPPDSSPPRRRLILRVHPLARIREGSHQVGPAVGLLRAQVSENKGGHSQVQEEAPVKAALGYTDRSSG